MPVWASRTPARSARRHARKILSKFGVSVFNQGSYLSMSFLTFLMILGSNYLILCFLIVCCGCRRGAACGARLFDHLLQQDAAKGNSH